MYKLLAIGSKDLMAGFALAGIEVNAVSGASEAADALEAAIACDEYGIIIVDEDLVERFDARMKQTASSSVVPLVLPVPGAVRWRGEDAPAGDDYVVGLIRQAIGYQLNIKL